MIRNAVYKRFHTDGSTTYGFQVVVNGQVMAAGVVASRAEAWQHVWHYRRNLRRYGSVYKTNQGGNDERPRA